MKYSPQRPTPSAAVAGDDDDGEGLDEGLDADDGDCDGDGDVDVGEGENAVLPPDNPSSLYSPPLPLTMNTVDFTNVTPCG